MYKVGYFMRANEGVYDVIRQSLPADSELVTLNGAATPESTIADLDFLIAGKVSREMIAQAPRLRLIMAPGVGTDGIDTAAASERGIPVAATICGNMVEVAEFTLMLMLTVSRRLTELDAALREGRWLMWDRRLQSRNLAGKTLGLVGHGRIGQAVGRRAAAFDMNVVYSDPCQSGGLPLADLLAESDFVSLHLPLTPESRGLMNASSIAAMKTGAVLINTARGELVDQTALVGALQSGKLGGAGLDVFEKEPLDPANPLLAMPNVVVSPHVASGTLDGLRVKAQQYAANIRRVLAGEEPIDLLRVHQEGILT